ncbi:hypothetical protein EDC04DRAFT_3090947 [Pisolithus marmoratus]|nr:hypothetical protein EDC04DRAFT_3090947 [Pisolithus marmoratus]
MQNKTSTLSLPDHAPPSTSTAQLSQNLARLCHLDYMHYGVAPGNGMDTIDEREPQCPISSSSENFYVSISELPSCSTIPAPAPQVPTSRLVGHLNGEQDVPLPLGFIAGESGGSLIASHLVNQGRGFLRAPDYVTNDDATLPSPYTTDLPQLIAIGQPPTYPQENENISTFGDLDHDYAGPAMRPSIRGHTSGQVIHSTVPPQGLSSPFLPSVSVRELCLSDGLNGNYFPLPPEQIRTGVAPPAELLSMQTIIQTHPQTPIRYPSPVLSRFHSTSANYISFDPSSLMPNQFPPSQSPQEHFGYLPVHPHHTIPAGLPGLRGFRAGSNADLYTTRIANNPAAHLLGDHPLLTAPNHVAQPFGNHATYIVDDHTAATISGGVDYATFDKSKCAEQVVGSRPQSSLSPNQLLLSPRVLHPHDRIDGRNLSGIIRHARPSSTSQSRTSTRLPKARSVGDCNGYHLCGWQDDNGRECGMPIAFDDCADHLATVHGIKNITWDVKVVCHWCSSNTQKKVIRKNLLRHLKEVHFGCPRAKEIYG